MADDEFSKQGGKAFQSVALGVAGLAGGPAGVALAVGGSVLFNIFEAVAERNTTAFQEARIAALEDDVRRVSAEVKTIQDARAVAGKPIDPPDPPTQARIFSDFAEAVGNAASPEKRTALVHAAANQFDPDGGSAPIRKYWFNEVRNLDDMEVVAIAMLAAQGAVIFSGNDTLGYGGKSAQKPAVKPSKLTFVFSERVAIENTLVRLQKQTNLVILGRAEPGIGQPYRLTWSGHAIARFMGAVGAANETAES